MVNGLIGSTPGLQLGAFAPACRGSDHAMDAVVAALTARAAAIGHATRPGPANLAAATTEGWIAVPNTPLATLTDSSAKG